MRDFKAATEKSSFFGEGRLAFLEGVGKQLRNMNLKEKKATTEDAEKEELVKLMKKFKIVKKLVIGYQRFTECPGVDFSKFVNQELAYAKELPAVAFSEEFLPIPMRKVKMQATVFA